MNVEYINPFVRSTVAVFRTMLKLQVERGTIFTKESFHPEYEVSGIVGLTGRAIGTVVVSLNGETARRATACMLGGEVPAAIDSDVVDAVGELANMIAGSAKAELQQFDLSVSIPNVITGTDYRINFPSDTPRLCIPFSCEWGEFSIEVGLVEKRVPALQRT